VIRVVKIKISKRLRNQYWPTLLIGSVLLWYAQFKINRICIPWIICQTMDWEGNLSMESTLCARKLWRIRLRRCLRERILRDMRWLQWFKVTSKLSIQEKCQTSNLHGSKSLKTRGLSPMLKLYKNTSRFFIDNFRMMSRRERRRSTKFCLNLRSRLFDNFKSRVFKIKMSNIVKSCNNLSNKNTNR